eukprot:SAG22_NODE_22040_length_252_cov_0.640523_1_plen_20_part_10
MVRRPGWNTYMVDAEIEEKE